MSEGIRVSSNNFKYASVQERLLAWIIDFALVNILLLLFVPGLWVELTNFIGEVMAGKFTFAEFSTLIVKPVFIVFWSAPVIYMTIFGGWLSRTPGMFVAKTRYAKLDGSKLSWLSALLRAVCYLVASLPIGLGFVPVLFDKKRQGLHDKMAQTIVILKR